MTPEHTRILGLKIDSNTEQVFWGPEADKADQHVFGLAIFNSREDHYVRRFGENEEAVVEAVRREPEFRRKSLHILTHQFSEWVSAILNKCHENPKRIQQLSGRSLDRYTHEVGRTWRVLGQQVCEQRSKLYSVTSGVPPEKQIQDAIEEMRRMIILPLRQEIAALKRKNAKLERLLAQAV